MKAVKLSIMMKREVLELNYLNTQYPRIHFRKVLNQQIYVDKSMLIHQLNMLAGTNDCYVCVTRPRRFGKTINANMLGAYYTKGYDSQSLFDKLRISEALTYQKHLNAYNVIYIDFSRMPDPCCSYEEYIDYIKTRLKADLEQAYGVQYKKGMSVMELKMGGSCDEAIAQIKERNYMQRADGCNEILLVGINYDEKKHHECRIERLM